MIGNAVLMAVVFAVSALGPGLVICGRLRWNPLEKLCAAVGVSWLVQFLIGFGEYAVGMGVGWRYAGGGVGLIGTIWGWGEIRRSWRARVVRRAVGSYLVVLVAGLVMVSGIRDLAGGEWFGDWMEHYQRTGFWLGAFPRGFKFIGDYALPARPPMANVLCASLLAQACPGGGYSFAAYQLGLLMLLSLVALPVGLVTRRVWPRGGRWTGVAVALLLLNPMFVQNLTYPWTRHFNTFYVLSGIALYLAGWRKGDRVRVVAGFLALTTAMLVHYSSGPWLLFVVLHYLFGVWWWRRDRWREIATIVVSCALVLGVWVGWSVGAYGWGVTFGANSVITDSSRFSTEGNVAKVAGNTYRTIVPLFLRGTPETIRRQESGVGFVRDYVFVTYQQNVIFALGALGAAIVGVLLWRSRREWPERKFWLALIPVVGLLGIAVNGTPDWYGYAHIVLQPMIYVGVCLVAAGAGSLSVRWKWLLLAAAAVDLCLGIVLHLWVEHARGEEVLQLSPAAVSNMEMKVQARVQYIGDVVGGAGTLALVVVTAAGIAGVVWVGRRLILSGRGGYPAPHGAHSSVRGGPF